MLRLQGFHDPGGFLFLFRRRLPQKANSAVRAGKHHVAPVPGAVLQPFVHERAHPRDGLAQFQQIHVPEGLAQHLYSGAEERPCKPHQHLDQRRLSGTVRAQDEAAFSALHLPGNIVQDFVAAQVYPGILHIDGRQGIVHKLKKIAGFRGKPGSVRAVPPG